MRKLMISLVTSLDGFVAGPNGEIDWAKVDEEQFDFIGKLTDQADTALYGRVTYQMMESYWHTAAELPNATKHDIEHSKWYKKVDKIVVSKTLPQSDIGNTKIISDNFQSAFNKIKQQNGKNILMFGSPTIATLLTNENLVDEYWIFVNPIILGKGKPFFEGIKDITRLKLLDVIKFKAGVIGLHYEKILGNN